DCAAMMWQAMLNKWRKRKVIFREGGSWWIPDLMLRLNAFYMSASGNIALTERKLAAGELNLKKLPSQYILDRVRFSTQPITIPKNRKHFAWMLELCTPPTRSASSPAGPIRPRAPATGWWRTPKWTG